MTKLLLDIGAGGSSFVRHFKHLNRHVEMMYLYGIQQSLHRWDKSLHPGAIQEVDASYADFKLSPGSLDVVTLNAPHPLMPPSGIEEELIRCLKSGGLFFSAHPIGAHPTLSKECFIPMNEQGLYEYYFERTTSLWSRWVHNIEWLTTFDLLFGYGSLTYPASPTVANRLDFLSDSHIFQELLEDKRAAYVYRYTDAEPTVKVWIKK